MSALASLTNGQRESVARRFWAKVNKDGPTQPHMVSPCWTWTGAKSRGYGQLSVQGALVRAHRLSFEMSGGDVGAEVFVCHRCDVPACIRPSHLFLGTNQENIDDMAAKGRGATGDRHGSKTHPERLATGDQHGSRTRPESRARGDANGARLHPERLARGERQGLAKLTEAAVREIRSQAASGKTLRSIAREFCVSESAVQYAVLRRTWRHVA